MGARVVGAHETERHGTERKGTERDRARHIERVEDRAGEEKGAGGEEERTHRTSLFLAHSRTWRARASIWRVSRESRFLRSPLGALTRNCVSKGKYRRLAIKSVNASRYALPSADVAAAAR